LIQRKVYPVVPVLLAIALAGAGCGSKAPAPADKAASPSAAPAAPADATSSRDPSAIKKEYAELQAQATAEVRAWTSQEGQNPDPRPLWAKKLEDFADAHPGTPEAADALAGVMQMRAALFDSQGFFRDFDLMLKLCPDAPGLAAVFPQVSSMRMAETGGRDVFVTQDLSAKQRAWRRAVPLIVADMNRAIAATSNESTRAAAEYTIGMGFYQFDVDLGKALKHFKVVAEQHPTWTYADSARQYIREIETLGPGQPAPDFTAVSLDGRTVGLSSLKGKIVLVDFWATWCEPCLHELPNLKRAHARFRGKGFTIVGVSADTDKAAVSRFVAREKMDWPIVMDDPIFKAYSVQAIPMSYLIDRSGKIRGRALYGSEVERTVGELLAQ